MPASNHPFQRRLVGLLLPAALVAVAILVASGSAGATSSTPLTITGQSIFSNDSGTFATSSGSGLCSTGITTDSNIGQLFATGGQSGKHIIFHDEKTFTCADGSGTFTMDLEVRLVFGDPADSFSWRIVSGSGAYADLHGTGSGVGTELPNEVDDSYAGSIHFN